MSPTHVVVLGSGFAGLETAFALRALASPGKFGSRPGELGPYERIARQPRIG